MNNPDSSKLAIVTGAAGFVGSHMVDRLLKKGFRVIGVDNFITGRKQNLAHLQNNHEFELIEADITQPADSYFPSDLIAPELIFHFASPASPPRYQAHPVETYLANSLGTHQLLTLIKENSALTKFVYAGTSEAYGDPEVHPQPETYWGNVNPNGVRSCYDESKRLGETICGVFNRDFGVDVRIARIFNTYGPRMDPGDGRVIPNFVKQAKAGLAYTIYGDGSQTRSYCFIEDLVEGFWRLATVDAASGETINLGNPGEYTVLETAKIIHKLINGDKPFESENHSMPGDDPTRRQPDITKAKEILGWEPQVDFESGIAQL